MKFIELHSGTDTRWVKVDAIKMIDAETLETRPEISSYILLDDSGYFFNETPEEILEKIAEAEQRHERSFMDDWQDRVDKQVGRLAFRKDDTKG